MKVNRLKGKLRENCMSQSDLADAIGISLSRLNAKLNGRDSADFVRFEICGICKALDLTGEECLDIFFDDVFDKVSLITK